MSCCPPGFQSSFTLTPTLCVLLSKLPSGCRVTLAILSFPALSGVGKVRMFSVYLPLILTMTWNYQMPASESPAFVVVPFMSLDGKLTA